MQLELPALIIVSGAPGSGKTTLATRIAAELRLPLLAKDRMKERLADALGVSDAASSQRLGVAAYSILFHVIDRLLAAGCGATVESNFRRDRSEQELLPFLENSDARLIHCQAAPELILARYRARATDPERHPTHHDLLRVDDMRTELDHGRYEPLRLPVPTLRVDTGDGYRPALQEILAFVAGEPAGFQP